MTEHDNSKQRTERIAYIARALVIDTGMAGQAQPDVLAVARLVAEAAGCHIDTAKRHVRRAWQQLRKPGYKPPKHGGLRVAGEAAANARLTAAAVRSIRHQVADGQPVTAVAAEHGISAATVYAIVQRRRWAHVD